MQNIYNLCQTDAFNLLQFNEAYESIHFNFLTGTPFREILTSRFLVQVCRKNHLAHLFSKNPLKDSHVFIIFSYL